MHLHTSKFASLTPKLLQWSITQVNDTKVFKLSAGTLDPNGGTAPTVDQDGKLFADISGLSATEWTVTECETCDEGVFMYVVPTLLFRYGRSKRADLFLVHSITDDVGNAWQTPQSDDQDPQVRLQYLLMFFFSNRVSVREKHANPLRLLPKILLEYLVIPLIYPPKYPTYAQFKFASVDDVD